MDPYKTMVPLLATSTGRPRLLYIVEHILLTAMQIFDDPAIVVGTPNLLHSKQSQQFKGFVVNMHHPLQSQ